MTVITDPVLDVERLNQLVRMRGLTPAELEMYSGVKYDTIYKIRTATRPRTSAEILAKLARALGCSVDYLLRLTDDPTPYAGEPTPDEIRELISLARQLSPARQRELAGIAEVMVRGSTK